MMGLADDGAARRRAEPFGKLKADETASSPPWWALSAEETLLRLGSSEKLGLAAAEARTRLTRWGPNALREGKRDTWLQMLARQFASTLIVILLVAAALAATIGEVVDALAILAIVILNAFLGCLQEWKAEQALAALKAMLRPKARVLRDGELQWTLAADLTPGDVVAVEIGDQIPADVRLVRAVNLQADEAALTGEAGGVDKRVEPVPEGAPLAERSCMAYMGATVVNGRGYGVVTATGMETELGRIAFLTETIGMEPTPLKRQLAQLGRQLGAAAIVISAVVAVGGWLTGKNIIDMFLTGVSLAVAIVPEGLPAVVTITLALGVAAMTRRRALLRRLQAAETLGAATVICTDKTGTLTRNEMTVTDIWLPAGEVAVTGVGYEPKGSFEVDGAAIDPGSRPDLLALLETGLICNHARLHHENGEWKAFGESTEASLVSAAGKAGLQNGEKRAVGELSFSSARKRMTVIVRDEAGNAVAHVKGAPELVLARSTHLLDGAEIRPLTDEDRARIGSVFTRMGENGLRVLAMARRTLEPGAPPGGEGVERELVFLGVAGIMDPPRPEAPEAVAVTRAAGVRVIVVTGDAGLTALSVARRVGLKAERFVAGPELQGMDDETLLRALDGRAVFARVSPEHKLRIVELLQSQGEVVAMTGDGVNDAPALKKSDVGVAMGKRGTDVARGAADMMLLDDNFATITGAIEEGRRQYRNIKKFVNYLLSGHLSEILAIGASLFAGGPLLLLPTQILWMNLVTDGPPALSLAMEPPEADLMQRGPRRPDERVIGWEGLRLILPVGVYMAAVAFLLFYYYGGTEGKEGLPLAQTMAFTAIIITQKLNVLNFRSFTAPALFIGLFRNPWVWLSIVSVVGLQVALVYVPMLQETLHVVPLDLEHWLVIFAVSAPAYVVPEAIKIALHKRRRS
jgi:Ca2+-transporting ATPase